jgi:Flp pilus assembly protein TadD
MRNPSVAAERSAETVLAAARGRLEREPASVPVRVLELLALAAMHREDETVAAADQLAASAPQDARAATARALAQREVGRAIEALRAAGEAVRLAPDDAAAQAALGLALAGAGKLVEAQSATARAVELAPRDARLHRQLGDRWRDVDPVRAERHYRDSLHLDWRSATTQLSLSIVLDRQGRRAEAQVAWDAAVALDPAVIEPRKRFRRDLLAVLQGGLAVFLVVVMIAWTQAIVRSRWPAARLPAAVAGWVAVVGLMAGLFVFAMARARRLRREAPPSPELLEALTDAAAGEAQG